MKQPIKIISIAGARPQFVKTGIMHHSLVRHPQIRHLIIHTGQHYDASMSDQFFYDLQIPAPAYNLRINQLSHGAMTGRMLEEIEGVLVQEKPQLVLVYGDTNSTLAGALAASKLHIPLAHIEAGLRSFDKEMPEEINRILTDRISDLLFCPTRQAMYNLEQEGYRLLDCEMHLSGDIMLDAALHFSRLAPAKQLLVQPFVVCTLHREQTLASKDKLTHTIEALNQLHQQVPVLFPAHPRTRAALQMLPVQVAFNLVEPFGYLEMLQAIAQCSCVVTDSGGLQKEAYFFKKPCITMRDSTEWKELVEAGVNILWKENGPDLFSLYTHFLQEPPHFSQAFYGTGNSCGLIVKKLISFINNRK